VLEFLLNLHSILMNGAVMAVDVYIVFRHGNVLGDEILRRFWDAAIKVFKEYGIEVYIMPLLTNEKGKEVSVIINGFEVSLNSLVTVDEAVDLILTYSTVEGDVSPAYALGIYIDRDDSLDNVVTI
jgi:hypothetical protein